MRHQILLIALIIAAGCGPHTEITWHENTPQEELNARTGCAAYGVAEWKYVGVPIADMKVQCDIWLLPYDLYPSDACYQAVVNHEKRHCYEGNFHAQGEGFEATCRQESIIGG